MGKPSALSRPGRRAAATETRPRMRSSNSSGASSGIEHAHDGRRREPGQRPALVLGLPDSRAGRNRWAAWPSAAPRASRRAARWSTSSGRPCPRRAAARRRAGRCRAARSAGRGRTGHRRRGPRPRSSPSQRSVSKTCCSESSRKRARSVSSMRRMNAPALLAHERQVEQRHVGRAHVGVAGGRGRHAQAHGAGEGGRVGSAGGAALGVGHGVLGVLAVLAHGGRQPSDARRGC